SAVDHGSTSALHRSPARNLRPVAVAFRRRLAGGEAGERLRPLARHRSRTRWRPGRRRSSDDLQDQRRNPLPDLIVMRVLPQRPFGKTGETYTAISLGTNFSGFAGFDRSVETIRRAFDLGVRYFDTSVMYQSGASQAILGTALAERTDKHFVATKVG